MRQVWILSVVVLVLFTSLVNRARASPHSKPEEDALADGDHDADDLVGRSTVGRAVLRRAPGGEAWVSLGGFTRRTLQGEREVGGLVVVGLPLDRIARSGTRAASVATNAVVTTSEPEGGGVTPRVARAAVEAAWRAASLGSDDARLDAIISRARWSAVLPETRLRAIRFDDQRLSTDATTTDASRLRDSTGANVGLEARLTWR